MVVVAKGNLRMILRLELIKGGLIEMVLLRCLLYSHESPDTELRLWVDSCRIGLVSSTGWRHAFSALKFLGFRRSVVRRWRPTITLPRYRFLFIMGRRAQNARSQGLTLNQFRICWSLRGCCFWVMHINWLWRWRSLSFQSRAFAQFIFVVKNFRRVLANNLRLFLLLMRRDIDFWSKICSFLLLHTLMLLCCTLGYFWLSWIRLCDNRPSRRGLNSTNLLLNLFNLLLDFVLHQELHLFFHLVPHHIFLDFHDPLNLFFDIFLEALSKVFGMVLDLSLDLIRHFIHYFFSELGDGQIHDGEGVFFGRKSVSKLLILHVWFLNFLEVCHCLQQVPHELTAALLVLFLFALKHS